MNYVLARQQTNGGCYRLMVHFLLFHDTICFSITQDDQIGGIEANRLFKFTYLIKLNISSSSEHSLGWGCLAHRLGLGMGTVAGSWGGLALNLSAIHIIYVQLQQMVHLNYTDVICVTIINCESQGQCQLFSWSVSFRTVLLKPQTGIYNDVYFSLPYLL